MYFNATDALTHNASRWDRTRWAMRADASAGLNEAERDVARMLAERNGKKGAAADARTFAGEVFSRLAEEPEAVESPTSWASKAQSIVDELPEFDALRASVAHDADLASLATKEILKAVASRLPALLDAQHDEADQGDQQGQGGAAGGQGGNGSGQTSDRAKAALRAALRRAVEQGAKAATDAREALEGLAPGMGATPATHEQEDTTRLALAEMLLNNPEFADVLRKAGKLRRLAQSDAKKRTSGAVGTIVGLERGADLGRVLPAQYARLRHPKLRTLLKKDLAERSLMQYRVEGHEPQGRGPIVILVDESGSMGGDPERWAKAAVIAAVRQGQAEKRPVHVGFFNYDLRDAYEMTESGEVHEVCTRTGERLDRHGDVSTLTRELLTRTSQGGTRFGPALNWASTILENGADRADVVIVTDGFARIDEATRERLAAQRERGTRLYALTVNGGNASALADLADETVPLDEVPEDEIAQRLARTIPTTP